MVNIPLGVSDYNRQVPKEARLISKNRFYDKNPVLNPDGYSLISRPTLRLFTNLSTEYPVRGIHTEPGTFSDASFIIAGQNLYKITTAGTVTDLGAVTVAFSGSVSFASIASIGVTPERMFFADGGALYCYSENGNALGRLVSTAIINGDKITINTTVYQMTSGSVDTGTPAGTAGNPWLVALGATVADSITNLYAAINNTGVNGTDYSTALTANPDVEAWYKSTDTLRIRALSYGAIPNTYVTTATSANMVWDNSTLTGGGTTTIFQVNTPDDVGITSVASINSYVICIPAQGNNINGRFYWIQPGETTIDPLDYATAERAPDAINEVVVFSDMFWLCGQSTTEPWIFTGNSSTPVQRFRGLLFDRGTWEGTAVQVKDSLILSDPDGAVFQIKGGLNRISTPDIEERIRRAMQIEAATT